MKIIVLLFLCIVDISARFIYKDEEHCNQEKYFCEYSNKCIDITDNCISYTYINNLFW